MHPCFPNVLECGCIEIGAMRFIITVLLILLAGVPTRSIDLPSYLDLGPADWCQRVGKESSGLLDPGSRDNSEVEDDDRRNFQLQQLLLAGFWNEDINSYNIRQPDGFTSNGGGRQCITVRYNITCSYNTDEICASMQNDSCNNADNWRFIWTVFNTRTTTGRMLLNITVYDLRVFGFELCDVYKPTINISINLNSTDDKPVPGKILCYDMCKALEDFTTLLPGLSNEQQNGSTPEAKGYGRYWYKRENIKKRGDKVTIFLILFIVMFKLTFVFFSYELYQKLIKQELHKKTHKRYYTYWSAQVLILGGLIGLSIFAGKYQSNRVALDTFWVSVGIDAIVTIIITIIIIVIVMLKAILHNPQGKAGDNIQRETKDNTIIFIPPPLLVCCQCCKCPISNERGKQCKQVIIVLANGVSLFLFLAIGSYVAQALPAIAMSYYVNPTSTLIRLGFFELVIFILLVEISYFIFLCDKCSWLCYITIRKQLPHELSNELDDTNISVYVKECKEEQNDDDVQSPPGDHNEPPDPNPHIAITPLISNGSRMNYGGTEGSATESRTGEAGSTGNTPGDPPAAPEPQNATQHQNYSCRWYWVFIVPGQIIAVFIVIGVSVPALYFLMQIVIDQTSNSNNDFKDLLSILPTIALNAWLLLKHGDIIHAMKEIMKSAAKEQTLHASEATTRGGQ